MVSAFMWAWFIQINLYNSSGDFIGGIGTLTKYETREQCMHARLKNSESIGMAEMAASGIDLTKVAYKTFYKNDCVKVDRTTTQKVDDELNSIVQNKPLEQIGLPPRFYQQ
jgi:hypothetical protein